MIHFSDNELIELLNDDLPYLDLTTFLQEKAKIKAKLEIFTRDDIVISGVEESSRIAKLLDCDILEMKISKTKVKKGETILAFSGAYENIHKVWRTTQLILEYSSQIATTTVLMLEKIKEVNGNCQLLTTRKTYPFSKKFCIKSVLNGGGLIHRLNLSETILFFPHHRKVYKDNLEFYEQILKFKAKMPEKKVVVESSSFEDCKNLFENGVDVVQLDKVSLDELKKVVELRDKSFKNIKIICSGGINLQNVQDFAKLKIDGVVTSFVYSCGMANLGSRLEIID